MAGTVDLSYNILANTARAAAAIEGLAARLERLSDRLDRINGQRAEADVDVDTAAAEAGADRILERLRRINGQRAEAKVDIDRSAVDHLAAINGALGALQKFALPVGIVALSPTLLAAAQAALDLSGLLGVAAGGMAALGAIAATVKVGFSGIPEVFKAMGAADKAATATATQSGAQRVQIAERIRSAQEGVATAMESSSRRVAGAEASLGQAQRQAQYAQEALNQARKDAKEDLEDLKLSLSGAAVSEEAAQIALERAQQHLAEAHAKGAQGLDLREAELGVKQASQALAEAHERYGDVKQASQEANRAGVEGSKQVVAAQRGVADANRATAAAQVDLKQAQVDGARQVADAQRALAAALQQTSTAGSAASKTLSDAMAKLAPNARDAVLAVRGLKPAWEALRVDVQDKLFAGLGATIKKVAGVELPVLRTGMGGVATQLNGVAQSLGEFFAKASTARDIGTIFTNTGTSVGFLRNAVTDVVAVFVDLATVGSGFLPSLSQGLAGATTRLREFVARARESGALAEWMQLAIHRTEQLGHIVGNVGGSLVSIFKAAGTSGGDFLGTVEKVTGELNKLLKTPTAQAGLSAFFRTISETIDALLPGVKEFALQFFNAVKAAADTGGLQKAGKAITDLLTAVAPLLPVLAKLAGETLGSLSDSAGSLAGPFKALVDSAKDLVTVLGPVGPAVVGAVLAFKALTTVGPIITTLGAQLAAMSLRIGGSEAAATKFAGVMGKIGGALPIVGAAVIGLVLLYDQLKDKTDEVAKSVLDGSVSLTAAVDTQSASMQRSAQVMHELGGEGEVVGQGIGELTGQTVTSADAVDTHAESVKNLLGEMDRHIAAMPPLQAAQAQVTREQQALNLATQDYGTNSPQAREAQDRLKESSDKLEQTQKDTAEATKSHRQAETDLAQAIADNLGTDLAYEQSLRGVEHAQQDAATAVREHGAGSLEARDAVGRLESAILTETQAAGKKAAADSGATSETDKHRIAVNKQNEELLRVAATSDGPAKEAALRLIGRLGDTETQTLRNTGAMNGFGVEIKNTPDGKVVTVTTPGLDAARSGIQGLQTDIRTINGKNIEIFVTALGQGGLASAGRLATGGILPGFTPGRDVHKFVGAAGLLELSGGEAIMRPEVTRVLGHKFVNDANRAARTAGVAGVTRFMGGGGLPAESRNDRPSMSFADGGVLLELSTKWHRDMTAFNAAMAAFETKAKSLGEAIFGGGPGLDVALAWARTQQGKPYQWGGVGNPSWDCCLIGGVRVYGPDGAQSIESLRPGARVFSYEDGRLTVHTVTAQWLSKRQPVFAVRTRNRTVTGSGNHPFLVVRMAEASRPVKGGRRGEILPARYGTTWSRLDELRRGDLLVQPRAMVPDEKPVPTLPDGTPVDADVAWLLGALVGDGSLTAGDVRLTMYGEQRDRAARIVAGRWHLVADYSVRHGVRWRASTALGRTLAAFGLVGRGPDKRTPDEVWTWPAALRRAFLDGYCAADGHRPADPTHHGDRTYHSASRELIEDARGLHIMLGDPVSNITTTKRRRPIIIGGKLVKNARDLHTFTVWPGVGRGEAALRVRPGLAAWLDSGEFTLARVLAVDPQGEQDTYDIEVEGAHNFVADGMVVHNSGFISGIVNVMRGQSPNRRVGTTASMPWPGFLPGLGPGLNVGNKPSDHMAGSIGAINVESASGRGVQVGGRAWGATNPYFTQRWHMPAPMAALMGAVGANLGGGEARAVVQQIAAQRGWGAGAEWTALAEIIRRESGWNPAAANPTSSARGLFQKMTSIYGPLEPTVAGQAQWGLNYIGNRYRDPLGALAWHNAHHWYANGGIVTRPTFGLLGEDGPEMVLPLNRPGRASSLMQQAGMGGDPALVVNVTTSPYASAERIIQSAMHQSRLNRMAGRYGGR